MRRRKGWCLAVRATRRTCSTTSTPALYLPTYLYQTFRQPAYVSPQVLYGKACTCVYQICGQGRGQVVPGRG